MIFIKAENFEMESYLRVIEEYLKSNTSYLVMTNLLRLKRRKLKHGKPRKKV